MLDGGDHQILHILALDPLCRGNIAQRLAVTAVEGKSYPHLLPIVTTELKSVRAPAQIGLRDRNAPVVPACLSAARMPL